MRKYVANQKRKGNKMSIFKKKDLKTKDLKKMTDEEYLEMKTVEMEEAVAWAEAIRSNPDPRLSRHDMRPVTDIRQMLRGTVAKYGDKVMYHQIMPGEKEFSEITFNQGYEHINGLGTALTDMGLAGEHIGVIGPNCYEWAETYLAIICGTGIVVPLDKELSQDDLTNLCIEGEIKAVICCSDKHYKMFKEIKDSKKTKLKYIIGINLEEHEDKQQGLYSWNILRQDGMEMVKNGDRRFIDARIRNTDLAVIIFTSGTTGVAKGVMLCHKNLAADMMFSNPYMLVKPSDIFFSVLPIHHTYECTCSMIECVYIGSSLAFCRGLKYINKDMQAVKPTFLLAVPLIYEKFYNSINKALVKEGKDKLVNVLFGINKLTCRFGINVAEPVARKIKEQFGGRIRMFIAGGAKVDPEVLAFFKNLGITTLQGYGLTETSPMVALNPEQWKYMKNDSAGKVLQLTEAKIVDADENGNGEICFRGHQVMLGYYNNQEATDECMEDGWFHTGDLGHIDKDGYVFITGRKKNVIIAANGKNVFPEELEEKIMRSKFIEECMVWADENGESTGQKGIYVTLRIDKENVKNELGEKSEDAEAIYALVDKEIDKVNADLPDWKSIKHIRIRKQDFVKTTGMKIKRFVEENKLGD